MATPAPRLGSVVIIPELLSLVLSFLDERSVAKIITVNIQWADTALDTVWRDVNDIRRLLGHLAPLVSEKQSGALVYPGFNHVGSDMP